MQLGTALEQVYHQADREFATLINAEVEKRREVIKARLLAAVDMSALLSQRDAGVAGAIIKDAFSQRASKDDATLLQADIQRRIKSLMAGDPNLSFAQAWEMCKQTHADLFMETGGVTHQEIPPMKNARRSIGQPAPSGPAEGFYATAGMIKEVMAARGGATQPEPTPAVAV